MHLQKGLVYRYTKMFLLRLLHFWNYNLFPNGQINSFIGAQAHLQTQFLIAEWCKVLKIFHISNRINLRRSQTSILYIRFPIFLCWRAMYHPSMYFLRKASFHFLPEEKICFREKIRSFQIIQERSCAGAALFGKTIFSLSLKKISYFRVFFKKDTFHFRFKV